MILNLAQLTHGDFVPMAEAMPTMLWLSDSKGECVYLNKALREFWGVDVADLPRFSWASTLLPDDHEAVFRVVANAVEKKTPFIVNGRYRRKDGVVRILETRAEPRFAPNGEFLGMIGTNRDVTDEAEDAGLVPAAGIEPATP